MTHTEVCFCQGWFRVDFLFVLEHQKTVVKSQASSSGGVVNNLWSVLGVAGRSSSEDWGVSSDTGRPHRSAVVFLRAQSHSSGSFLRRMEDIVPKTHTHTHTHTEF